MASAQRMWRESLRDIEACLPTFGSRPYDMGSRSPVARDTLANADALRRYAGRSDRRAWSIVLNSWRKMRHLAPSRTSQSDAAGASAGQWLPDALAQYLSRACRPRRHPRPASRLSAGSPESDAPSHGGGACGWAADRPAASHSGPTLNVWLQNAPVALAAHAAPIDDCRIGRFANGVCPRTTPVGQCTASAREPDSSWNRMLARSRRASCRLEKPRTERGKNVVKAPR
jgi:hypothetical protein